MNALPIALALVVMSLLSFIKFAVKEERGFLTLLAVLAIFCVLVGLLLMVAGWLDQVTARCNRANAQTEAIESRTERAKQSL